MKPHQKLTAIICCVFGFSAYAEPVGYWIKDYGTKVVWKAPQRYEYAPPNHRTRYGWCGHAALSIALESFGIYCTMSEMDRDFIAFDSTYTHKTRICPMGRCPGFYICASRWIC